MYQSILTLDLSVYLAVSAAAPASTLASRRRFPSIASGHFPLTPAGPPLQTVTAPSPVWCGSLLSRLYPLYLQTQQFRGHCDQRIAKSSCNVYPAPLPVSRRSTSCQTVQPEMTVGRVKFKTETKRLDVLSFVGWLAAAAQRDLLIGWLKSKTLSHLQMHQTLWSNIYHYLFIFYNYLLLLKCFCDLEFLLFIIFEMSPHL